jgi:hypothetical protein
VQYAGLDQRFEMVSKTALKNQSHPVRSRPARLISDRHAWLLFALAMAWVARNTIGIRRRSGAFYDAIDTMAMVQIGIVAAIFLVILNCPVSKIWKRVRQTSLTYYFLFYLAACALAVFSLNPKYSLYRAGEVIALSAAVILFCLNGSTVEKTVQRTLLVAWSTIGLMVLAAIKMRGLGLTLRDNGLGAAAAMTACFFVVWVLIGGFTRNRKLLIQCGVATALVVMSMSLGSWWSFWFGISYASLFTKRKAVIIALSVLGVALFLILGADTRENLLIRDKTIEEVMNAHGRKLLWENYLEISSESPLVGYGFTMGAREAGAHYTTHAHNAFFGALLGVGWIGIGIWVCFIVKLLTELFHYGHALRPIWLACAAALAAGALNSMSISMIAEQWHPATTVFVAFLALHGRFVLQSRSVRLARRRQRAANWRSRPLVTKSPAAPASGGGPAK